MFIRFLYTIKQMVKYKEMLKSLKYNNYLESIVHLTPEFLIDNKIVYLALDFDGVLASHGKSEIALEVKEWLDYFVTKFDESNIFILSNNPTQERSNYFKKYFPKIVFISDVLKKPYPDGLNKIINITNCVESKKVALIDDRILTGALSCFIAGCYPILITKPYVDREKYIKKEQFFKFLRYWERKIFL